MARLPSERAAQALRWALGDPETIERYWSHVRAVAGSPCAWWSGALSGRGHGRFWLACVDGRDVTVIAHRFAFGLAYGAQALLETRVLGHRCDNPLCQRVDGGHVRASSPLLNRREWAARRRVTGSVVNDRRGARGRARALRDAVRDGGVEVAALEALGRDPSVQLPLWGTDRQGEQVVGAPRGVTFASPTTVPANGTSGPGETG